MKNVPASLIAAITSPERVLIPRVSCDWDGDGPNGLGTVDDLSRGISDLEIDLTLTSNIPSVAQPVAGAAVGQLKLDVEQGHLFGEPEYPIVRNITSSSAATGTGTVSITRGAVKPGDFVFIWIAHSGTQFYLYNNGMNATWEHLFERGDFNSSGSHVTTGHLLVRRVGITQADADAEPSTYTFVLSSFVPSVVHCVVVASGRTPGIHAFTQKGSDPTPRLDDTYGLLAGRRITTTVDNCLIIGFFAGYAVTGGGVTWTPQSPATELADTCSASGTKANAATCITQISNASAGSYTLGATISASTEPGVVATIALAPMIAGDDTQNASWTYSELNLRSLLAGKSRVARPITSRLDVATSEGIQSITLFTGKSLGVDVSSRSRKATLTALDNRELMRNDVSKLSSFSAAIIAENPLKYPGETLPLFPGLEATWMVSYVFSYCRTGQIDALVSPGAPAGDGFFASPNIRTSTILHVPCHGSLEPFQGTTKYAYMQDSIANQSRPKFEHGPWVASTSAAPTGGKIDAKWHVGSALISPWKNSLAGDSSTIGRIELYLQASPSASGTATIGCVDANNSNNYFYLDLLASGSLQLRLHMDVGISRTIAGPSFPADNTWHAVGVHWDSTTGSAIFKVDSTTTNVGFSAFTNGSLASFTDPNGFATLTNTARMAELQIAGGYPFVSGISDGFVITASTPFMWDNFVPTAYIDKSENIMDSTLAIDPGVDCYSLLTELAEAEFAAVYFDSDGKPHYRTRYSDNTTTGQTVQRTLTTLNALKDVDYQSGIDQLANNIQVPFTPIIIDKNVQVWEPTSPLRIPANSTDYQVNITLPGIRDQYFTDVITIGNGNTNPDGSGTVITTDLAINIVSSGTEAVAHLSNGNPIDVWMVDISGNPTISWNATVVKSGPATLIDSVTNSDSIRAHGTQIPVNGISENKWRQRQSIAETLARLLLSDLAEPKPVLTNVKIVGDPRLEIGDLVRFVDHDGLGFDGNYRIVGITSSYTIDEGFTQTLSARHAGCASAIWDASYWDDCSTWAT
jgi:hypothetical protein